MVIMMKSIIAPIVQNAIGVKCVGGEDGEFMGRGGALVESKPFDRRVVVSNPALAAT